jgi:hypothetical protein
MFGSLVALTIAFGIALVTVLGACHSYWTDKWILLEAVKRGTLGLTIGLGICIVIATCEPASWTIERILVAVGMTSFFGPFGTVLAIQKKLGD